MEYQCTRCGSMTDLNCNPDLMMRGKQCLHCFLYSQTRKKFKKQPKSSSKILPEAIC